MAVDHITQIFALEQLVQLRTLLRQQNKTFVLTNGCFDLLHRGHVEYLVESSKLGDFLAVAVNSDESIRTLKGEGRPVNNERDRAFLVASLGCVNATVLFRGPRLANEIRALCPDVYTKAGDYSLDRLDESERIALLEVGAKVVFTPFAEGFSTTALLQRIHPSTDVVADRTGNLLQPIREN